MNYKIRWPESGESFVESVSDDDEHFAEFLG